MFIRNAGNRLPTNGASYSVRTEKRGQNTTRVESNVMEFSRGASIATVTIVADFLPILWVEQEIKPCTQQQAKKIYGLIYRMLPSKEPGTWSVVWLLYLGTNSHK